MGSIHPPGNGASGRFASADCAFAEFSISAKVLSLFFFPWLDLTVWDAGSEAILVIEDMLFSSGNTGCPRSGSIRFDYLMLCLLAGGNCPVGLPPAGATFALQIACVRMTQAAQFAPCIASRWEQSNPDNFLPREGIYLPLTEVATYILFKMDASSPASNLAVTIKVLGGSTIHEPAGLPTNKGLLHRVNLFSARKKPIHRRGRGGRRGKPTCFSSASSAVKKVLSLWVAAMSGRPVGCADAGSASFAYNDGDTRMMRLVPRHILLH